MQVLEFAILITYLNPKNLCAFRACGRNQLTLCSRNELRDSVQKFYIPSYEPYTLCMKLMPYPFQDAVVQDVNREIKKAPDNILKCQIYTNSNGKQKWYTSHLDFRDFPFDPTLKRAITHVAIFSQLEALLSIKDFTCPIGLDLVILNDYSEPPVIRILKDLEREVRFLTRPDYYISSNSDVIGHHVTRNNIIAEAYVKGISAARKEVKDILTTKQELLKSLLTWSDTFLWKNRVNRPTHIQADFIKIQKL